MVSRIALFFLVVLLLIHTPLAAAGTLNGPVPPAGVAEQPPPDGEEGVMERIGRGFSLYRENYLLPLTWGNRAARSEDAELKFQLSFKQHLGRNFYLAYTQKSFWRILDGADSRPFRETNYNPQAFYHLERRPEPRLAWGADLGFEHESNGAREPGSRSWNRLFVAPFIQYGGLRTELKVWHRISEKVKEDPLDPTGDENPDIEDFYGYGELRVAYETPRRYRSSLMLRYNFATRKGGVQLDFSIPTGAENLYFYGQLWTGYGESLIDYNRSLTRYGIGLLIRQ